jgi:CreA protein
MQRNQRRNLLILGLGVLHGFLVQPSSGAIEIGSVDTAWNLVKNSSVIVERFDDPQVDNVSCYVSRAKTGGPFGAAGFAEDPARMSIECRATGPVRIVGYIDKSPRGELVFSERASPFFKTIRVTRFYDAEKEVLVYLVWSTQLIDGSPYNSVTAVNLHN